MSNRPFQDSPPIAPAALGSIPPAPTLPTQNLIASEPIAAGAIVHIWQGPNGARARNANSSDPLRPARAYTTAPASLGGVVTVFLPGTTNNVLSGLAEGADYYLGQTPGSITTDSQGGTAQYVGTATSSTTLAFNPSHPNTAPPPPPVDVGVTSFDTRTGDVVLTSDDVITALGYTPGMPGLVAAGDGLTVASPGTISLIEPVVRPTGDPVAGQSAIFSGPSSITAGVITVPTLEPVSGFYFGSLVDTPNASGNLSAGAFADYSTLTATPGFYVSFAAFPTINESPASGASYFGLDVGPTFTGSDAGGAVYLGNSLAPNYSGSATGGSGSEVDGLFVAPTFSGTGTLDKLLGLTSNVYVTSGTVTEVFGATQLNISSGATVGTADGQNSSAYVDSGGTLTDWFSFHDYGATGATNNHGFWQESTGGANQFYGTLTLKYISPSALLVSDAGTIVRSGFVGVGLNLDSAGSLTNAGVVELEAGAGIGLSASTGTITVSNTWVLPTYTVATLPASPADGSLAMATDCTLTAITGLGLAPTGGGSNKVPVYGAGGGWLML